MKKLKLNQAVIVFFENDYNFGPYTLRYFSKRTVGDERNWHYSKESKDAYIFETVEALNVLKDYIQCIGGQMYGKEFHVLGFLPKSKDEVPLFR